MAKGTEKIFSVEAADTGEIKRLVQAKTEGEVRKHLLKEFAFGKPSALTVTKLLAEGMKVEVA